MSEPKPPSPHAETLGKQLKDSLAHRRPRPWKAVIATLIGSVLLLALLAWWLYPRPKPGPLQIMALDVIAAPDEEPQARAQLLAPPEDATPRNLSGHTIVFHEQALLLQPGAKPRETVAKSDARGQAAVNWPIAPATLAEFLVLHVDAAERRGSPRERARIFVFPKDAPILIVDAAETLIVTDDLGLDKTAAEALAKAETDGWRMVFLCLAGTEAHEFRKARGWLEKQVKLPKGPILGRAHFTKDYTLEEARRDVLKSLQSRFKGPMVAVVKSAEASQACKELGLRTIVLGAVPGPLWGDVTAKLKKE